MTAGQAHVRRRSQSDGIRFIICVGRQSNSRRAALRIVVYIKTRAGTLATRSFDETHAALAMRPAAATSIQNNSGLPQGPADLLLISALCRRQWQVERLCGGSHGGGDKEHGKRDDANKLHWSPPFVAVEEGCSGKLRRFYD